MISSIVLAVIGAGIELPAFASGVCGTPSAGHCYSTAFDNSDTNYSGIKITRKDLAIAPAECLFQPAWIEDAAATNWVELGSEYGPGCTGPANTWYWGYGVNGNWFKLGTRALTAGQTHVFSIYYYTGYYYYYIDSTLMGSYYWNRWFSKVNAGLESVDPAASVGPFQDSSMQYTVSGGSWKSWAGEDLHSLEPMPPPNVVCGHWVSATNWQAGENVGTC